MSKTEKGKTSSGTHSNVDRKLLNAMRSGYLRSGDRMMNQRRAFDSGKNVVVTIPNPNPHEANWRFVRVNARDVWKRAI